LGTVTTLAAIALLMELVMSSAPRLEGAAPKEAA
jgi:hypothetical protein